MGSIVSAKREESEEPGVIQPSAVFAAEARLRQEMMMTPNYVQLTQKLHRNDAFDNAGSSFSLEREGAELWYPAGVPVWYGLRERNGVYETTRETAGPVYDANWMNTMNGLTTRELHHAAALIQKTRGHQADAAVTNAEQKSAVKIQRSYRQYKRRQSEQQLLSKPYLSTFNLNDQFEFHKPVGLSSSSKREMTKTELADSVKQEVSSRLSTGESENNKAENAPEAAAHDEGRVHYTTVDPSRMFKRSKSNEETATQPIWNRHTSYTAHNTLSSSLPALRRSLPSLANPARQSFPPASNASRQTDRSLRHSTGELKQSQWGSLPSLTPDPRQTHSRLSKSPAKETNQESFGSLPSLVSSNATPKGMDSLFIGSLGNHLDPQRQLSRKHSPRPDHTNSLGSVSLSSLAVSPSGSRRSNSRSGVKTPRSRGRAENDCMSSSSADSPCKDCFVQGTDYKKCMETMKLKREQEKANDCAYELSPMPAKTPQKPKRRKHSNNDYSPCLEALNEERSLNVSQEANEPPLDDSLIDMLYDEIGERSETVLDGRNSSKECKSVDHSPDSFTPHLAPITEDGSLSDLPAYSPPGKSSNAPLPPAEKLKRINSIMDILYINTTEDKSPSLTSLSDESESTVELPQQLVNKLQTAILQRQLTKESIIMSRRGSEKNGGQNMYGQDSILIAPPDVKTLLKAAEFRGGVVRKLKHLTTSIALDYFQFVNEVEQVTYYAAQQAEAALSDYQPQTIMLVSSTVPKCALLRSSVKPGVIVHIYDFQSSLADLLDTVRDLLNKYKPGSKAKYIGMVCKGGPGYFYLVAGVPVTTVRLRSNPELLRFWQLLGCHMSKLLPGQSVIHLMESNVAGNKKGEMLLEDLEAAMFSNQIKVKSPIELAPSGREMLDMYFDTRRHKLWKMMRYTKLKIF